ncbi:23S rRNA (cytidine1920-2'-O)/16S rRNA (cytidine1409-2'-O)-methyltransferase [Stackebrandtia albiflava]|uniref:23S rRNA (Cytidine1920-2'-O)/16S rRNA (Cytidine1409-2'-O)-methyltransferase n=1 Tax=Stackebrandtia albiflava TaxID=406432 RepID=A0A562VEU2_9ACTN|nr:TlyA family RNA methyltransferase [Stackebrandtia albiflava]TWJ16406.1 23S rRNA (cytidine1920-2'-O)/16S rRNA (cytidine1409-2'-O)-methyltransferase [Stackebrandtia albiflava]
MAARRRLDAELVRRKLARSRAHAAELIDAGKVRVRGLPAGKAAAGVDPADPIVVADAGDDYVSRGAHKLRGALAAFGDVGVSIEGRRCLDAGASTGGFTDVLLREGAAQVVAVDVGYGQLAWSLQSDPRVVVRDRTNVRSLSPDDVGGRVDVTVADLSFISLRLVLPALAECTRPDGFILPMVKPQFEVGRGRVGSGGVVRDPRVRADAVVDVAAAAAELGWVAVDVVASPLPGPSGNVEFFCALRRDAEPMTEERIRSVVVGVSGPEEASG